MLIVQQIQKRMLVSIAQIAKELDLQEGDHVVVEQKDGGIFLRPVAWVDKNQKYFWTQEWQEKIRRSQEALEKGEYTTFNTMEEAIQDLEEMADAHHHQNKPV